MAKNDIQLKKTDTIFEELDRLHRAISQRAYDFFRNQESRGPLADWLTAEHELVWKPAIEVRTKDNQFEIHVATPGVDAKDLDVQITPEDLLVQAKIDHEHTAQKGDVQVCEFKRGKLFRSIHFPAKIDPESVKAEYRNGMLRLTAAIAKAAPTKVDIKAA
jgi:HSP20 family protein